MASTSWTRTTAAPLATDHATLAAVPISRCHGSLSPVIVPINDLRLVPTTTGRPSSAQPAKLAQQQQIVLGRFPEADSRVEHHPRSIHARLLRGLHPLAQVLPSPRPPRPRNPAHCCIVAGWPFMCIRIIGASRLATSGNMSRIIRARGDVVDDECARHPAPPRPPPLAWYRPITGRVLPGEAPITGTNPSDLLGQPRRAATPAGSIRRRCR